MYVTCHSLDNQDRQGRPLSLTLTIDNRARNGIGIKSRAPIDLYSEARGHSRVAVFGKFLVLNFD